MRIALTIVLGLAVVLAVGFAFVAGAQAEEKKSVTLEGTITCAKCDLKEADTCHTVIKVKDKDSDKDVVYYFDDKAGKANHKQICKEGKKGKVTGTVSEKDGKKMIKVTKVDFAD